MGLRIRVADTREPESLRGYSREPLSDSVQDRAEVS